MSFGDAYMDGRIEVEGDLVRFLEAIYLAMEHPQPPASGIRKLASKWMDLAQDNSRHGSRNNIHRHYDLGNDFYKLWLDEQLLYTCAYFPTPSSTLEHAQIAKMDHVCRKLRLQPGETVVEAGCGWGALALHMAREYGVSVKAYNVSHEQIAFARERARAEGLSHRVEYIEDDYRAISGKFDVFVSVGMLEHVGLDHFPEFSEIIHRTHRRHRPRAAALHRAQLSRGVQPLDSQAHFPRGIRSVAARVFEGSGAQELLGSGRGESAHALRHYTGALAGAF